MRSQSPSGKMKKSRTSGVQWTRDGAFCLHSHATRPAPLTPGVRRNMRVFLNVVIVGAFLGLTCCCRSSAPKNVQSTADRQAAVTPHPAPADLRSFGAPVEGTIRVEVSGYGVEQPGYY